jgi:hypothetical protein
MRIQIFPILNRFPSNVGAALRKALGWNGRETRDRTVKKRGLADT